MNYVHITMEYRIYPNCRLAIRVSPFWFTQRRICGSAMVKPGLFMIGVFFLIYSGANVRLLLDIIAAANFQTNQH